MSNVNERDVVQIPLKEAAEEWASPSAIVVNGQTYLVSVEYEGEGE